MITVKYLRNSAVPFISWIEMKVNLICSMINVQKLIVFIVPFNPVNLCGNCTYFSLQVRNSALHALCSHSLTCTHMRAYACQRARPPTQTHHICFLLFLNNKQ